MGVSIVVGCTGDIRLGIDRLGKVKRGTIELYYVTISLTQDPTYY